MNMTIAVTCELIYLMNYDCILYVSVVLKMCKKINPTGSFTTIPLMVRAVLVSNL